MSTQAAPTQDPSLASLALAGESADEYRSYLERLKSTPELYCLDGASRDARVWVEASPCRIGSGFNCHLRLEDPSVALLHAIVERTPAGTYRVHATQPLQSPLLSQRWGRARPTPAIALRHGQVFRLGKLGPRIRFRFLGEPDRTGLLTRLVLSARFEEPLLPILQVVSRLREVWRTATLNPGERHVLQQALRQLARLRFYRGWFFAWAAIALCLSLLTISRQLLLSDSRLEASTLRFQLNTLWQQQHAPQEKTPASPTEVASSDPEQTLLGQDAIAQQIKQIMLKAGASQPVLSMALVTRTRSEIDKEVRTLKRGFEVGTFMDRFQKFHPRAEDIFRREFQLPPMLAYLAWLESHYTLDAEGTSGQLGMWQLTEDTAMQYELVTDKGEDFRMDFEASTRGTGRYLAELVTRYGLEQLPLVVAAFHTGPDTLDKVMRHHQLWRQEQRTFPFLLNLSRGGEENTLDADTLNYVPRFFAVQIIAANRSYYLP